MEFIGFIGCEPSVVARRSSLKRYASRRIGRHREKYDEKLNTERRGAYYVKKLRLKSRPLNNVDPSICTIRSFPFA